MGDWRPEAIAGEEPAAQTRLARLSPIAAWGVILGLLVLTEYLVIVSADIRETVDVTSINVHLGDALLYQSVAARVQRGEDYYVAAASELRSRNYPIDSVFNWRMPTYAWIFGGPLGPALGYVLLIVGILVVATVAYVTIPLPERQGWRSVVAVTLIGSCGWGFHSFPGYYMELWAGLLIFVSSCMIGRERWGWGVTAAIMAMGVRELTLPYVLLIVGLAIWNRRYEAALTLLIGLEIFFILFQYHACQVAGHAAVATSGNFHHWIAYGGIPFLLAIIRMNFLLAMLPIWCTPVYTSLAVLGLLSWEGRPALVPQFTTIIYLLFFAIAGVASNYYWGWMIVPFLVIGFLYSPFAVRDLILAIIK